MSQKLKKQFGRANRLPHGVPTLGHNGTSRTARSVLLKMKAQSTVLRRRKPAPFAAGNAVASAEASLRTLQSLWPAGRPALALPASDNA